jgi:hypothetical protein
VRVPRYEPLSVGVVLLDLVPACAFKGHAAFQRVPESWEF